MNVLRNQTTIAEACESYFISPRTCYRWINGKYRLVDLKGGSEANLNSKATPFARRMPRMNQVHQGPAEEDEWDARRPRVLEFHSVRCVSPTLITPARDSQLPTSVVTIVIVLQPLQRWLHLLSLRDPTHPLNPASKS